jgi:hypothetical protein
MAKNERKQQIIWTGSGVVWRTVRHITQWDGRTVGIVRTGLGAEHVVYLSGKGQRWDPLMCVPCSEIRDLELKANG